MRKNADGSEFQRAPDRVPEESHSDRDCLGRPRGRGAKSIPNRPAGACCHASLPKGMPRRNDRRSASTSASVCGSLT